MNALKALRLIADGGSRPCRQCGRAHDLRPGVPTPKHYGSWADPDDGHHYSEMSVQEFAQKVVRGEVIA